MPDSLLERWALSADALYAADSGADRLLGLGFEPVLVGDLDSFRTRQAMNRLRVVHIAEQETTDCDKMLRVVASDGHASITLACLEGDLIDHMLSSFASALRSPLAIRFAFRRGIGWLVRPGDEVCAGTQPGRRVSLIPLTPCEGACIQGVAWPLREASLALDGPLSISNAATSSEVRASLGSGGALLFVEYPDAEMPRW